MEYQIIYNLGTIPDWITAVVAVIALVGVWIAYKDFSERTRPYIDVEIQTAIDNKNWHFTTLILNKGQYPVYSRITNALLIIGDEKYPTTIDQEIVSFPGEDKKIVVPVGHINEIGRNKIRGAKYTKNVVELQVEVSSRKLKERKYRYKTTLRVQVLVEKESPQFILLEKSFS